MTLDPEMEDFNQGINVPLDLHEALKSVLDSSHPLDADADFDPVEYLNSRFPDSNSLGGLHEYSTGLQNELECLDAEILNGIRVHAQAAQRSFLELEATKEAISELATRIVSIRDRAEESEKTVKTVSRDIVSLDTAKKNVSATINTLKKLVMMVNACEQLAELGGTREYAQTPALVLSIKDLEGSFDDIKHLPRVEELLKHKERVFTDLRLQITEDFDLRVFLSCPTLPNSSEGPRIISSKEEVERIDFAGAAQAVDALGHEVRMEIINRYCLLMMDDYKKQFAPSGPLASLEHYDKRFQWLTKGLKEFTDKHVNLFPQEWVVNGELCMHFCHETRQHFLEVLSSISAVPARISSSSPTGQSSPNADTPDLMITVLIKCLELENDMQRRFDKLRKKLHVAANDHHLQFKGVITSCFDQYLGLWVVYEERRLASTIHSVKSSAVKSDELMGTSVQVDSGEPSKRVNSGGDSVDNDPPLIFVSAVNLFASMRALLERCRQVDTAKTMADLFGVFRRTIASYVDSVIKTRLPAHKQIHSANEETLVMLCALIGSCDYCLKMTPHLHKNCLSVLDKSFDISVYREIEELADMRDMCQDTLMSCVTGCSEMRGAVSAISHMDWWNCESASGISVHVHRIQASLEKSLNVIGKKLSEPRFKALIELIGHKLISQVNETVYSSKPIGEIGAQQLLVDIGQIRNILLETPTRVFPDRKPQTTYVDLVNGGLHRLECSLKALASPACGDKQSLRTMLDSLDPQLSQSGPGSLEKEVDRLLSLRKGPTNSSTLHAKASMSSLLGGSLESHLVGDKSPTGKANESSKDMSSPSVPSAASTSSRNIKPDLRADITKLKNKFFGGPGHSNQ